MDPFYNDSTMQIFPMFSKQRERFDNNILKMKRRISIFQNNLIGVGVANGGKDRNMRIRPYIESRDYRYLEKWIGDSRIHALWCANLFPYPLMREQLRNVLKKNAEEREECAYIATEDDGEPVGFFCYSVNTESNAGFLKFIIINSEKRGMGYGQRMLKLALRYAFEITGANMVHLNVFKENKSAHRCYEKVGFYEKHVEESVFSYQNEKWSRCSMEIRKD